MPHSKQFYHRIAVVLAIPSFKFVCTWIILLKVPYTKGKPRALLLRFHSLFVCDQAVSRTVIAGTKTNTYLLKTEYIFFARFETKHLILLRIIGDDSKEPILCNTVYIVTLIVDWKFLLTKAFVQKFLKPGNLNHDPMSK